MKFPMDGLSAQGCARSPAGRASPWTRRPWRAGTQDVVPHQTPRARPSRDSFKRCTRASSTSWMRLRARLEDRHLCGAPSTRSTRSGSTLVFDIRALTRSSPREPAYCMKASRLPACRTVGCVCTLTDNPAQECAPHCDSARCRCCREHLWEAHDTMAVREAGAAAPSLQSAHECLL
jgi:hypothetical protein